MACLQLVLKKKSSAYLKLKSHALAVFFSFFLSCLFSWWPVDAQQWYKWEEQFERSQSLLPITLSHSHICQRFKYFLACRNAAARPHTVDSQVPGWILKRLDRQVNLNTFSVTHECEILTCMTESEKLKCTQRQILLLWNKRLENLILVWVKSKKREIPTRTTHVSYWNRGSALPGTGIHLKVSKVFLMFLWRKNDLIKVFEVFKRLTRLCMYKIHVSTRQSCITCLSMSAGACNLFFNQSVKHCCHFQDKHKIHTANCDIPAESSACVCHTW